MPISYFLSTSSSAIPIQQSFTSFSSFQTYFFDLYTSNKAYGFTDYGTESSWFPPNPDLEIGQNSILRDLNTWLSRVWRYYSQSEN